MSKELTKAQAQFQAGEFKRAVDTLWEVTFVGDQAEADASAVVALATLLREETQGGVRSDCEEHIARAERFLGAGADTLAGKTAGAAGTLLSPSSTIDAVEAEGWRLEHVACMFRPTKVQTSVLRGAEVFMGGDIIDGEETHIYLFRRVDEASG